MSQEHPPPGDLGVRPRVEGGVTNPTLRYGGTPPFPLSVDGNASAPTPNCYWQLFDDPGLSPQEEILGRPESCSKHFATSPTKSKLSRE
ncbi:hypothetical protein GW17_00058326 [Ensete ventricosum]|nr:hypothetical protein GW17_00058326 [Ensete ventricosum]RZR95297.1 hypothetical protein BHM03_00024123 [Ensete ventricosum]